MPIPVQSRSQFSRWLASSHQTTVSYRLSVLPVTSTRNGAMISAKPFHGSGGRGPGRSRWATTQTAGTSSISSGYATSLAPKPLPANCGSPVAKVATTSWATVAANTPAVSTRPRRDPVSLSVAGTAPPLRLIGGVPLPPGRAPTRTFLRQRGAPRR